MLDLIRMGPAPARAGCTVVLERTVRELQGTSCIAFEEYPPSKQEIACTRSFGLSVRDPDPLMEAVSTFASRSAEKLRRQDGHAAMRRRC